MKLNNEGRADKSLDRAAAQAAGLNLKNSLSIAESQVIRRRQVAEMIKRRKRILALLYLTPDPHTIRHLTLRQKEREG